LARSAEPLPTTQHTKILLDHHHFYLTARKDGGDLQSLVRQKLTTVRINGSLLCGSTTSRPCQVKLPVSVSCFADRSISGPLYGRLTGQEPEHRKTRLCHRLTDRPTDCKKEALQSPEHKAHVGTARCPTMTRWGSANTRSSIGRRNPRRPRLNEPNVTRLMQGRLACARSALDLFYL